VVSYLVDIHMLLPQWQDPLGVFPALCATQPAASYLLLASLSARSTGGAAWLAAAHATLASAPWVSMHIPDTNNRRPV